MSEFDFGDEYKEPIDIRPFCKGLEVAWMRNPDITFSEVLDEVFDGYPVGELTSTELQEMLNEYILQNT